jgi:hypothetical protein
MSSGENSAYSSRPELFKRDFGSCDDSCVLLAEVPAEVVAAVPHGGYEGVADELLEQYVDVAVERWQAFTGEEAHLESDGGGGANLDQPCEIGSVSFAPSGLAT